MVPDVMMFQDVRVSVELYLEGLHDEAPSVFPMPLEVTWRLRVDAFQPDPETGEFLTAIVHITQVHGGATEGWLDRSDKIRLDCYAPGEAALGTLKTVKAMLVGENIETPNGLLDTVTLVPGRAPVEVEFQSDSLNQATATLEIVHRPIN